MVVHESPHYIVVQQSPPLDPQPNPVGPISAPSSMWRGAYNQRLGGIQNPDSTIPGWEFWGGFILSVKGGSPPVAARPTRSCHPAVGPPGPYVARGAVLGGGGGSSSPGWGPAP